MWKNLYGRMRLEITSADSIRILNLIRNNGIYTEDVEIKNDLTLNITIYKNQYKAVCNICEKFCASIKFINKFGLYWTAISIIKHPILLIFILLSVSFFCFIQSRVFFIYVEGNEKIATNQILEAAEECGIKFGVSRRQIRSEKMKNALLHTIPELQWAGINTSGCTATISVKEKTIINMKSTSKASVSNIVAIQDGIIKSCIVYAGNQLCSVGEAVKAGQTLVSGYSNFGNITLSTNANAEITALTSREIEVISPVFTEYRKSESHRKTYYSIKIGKNILKFNKDSGNSYDECVKIYKENYIQLPGGFQLPIAIIQQTIIFYNKETNVNVTTGSADWMTEYANNYLLHKMIAGEIISQQIVMDIGQDLHYFYCKYACIEIIGQEIYEQTMIGDE